MKKLLDLSIEEIKLWIEAHTNNQDVINEINSFSWKYTTKYRDYIAGINATKQRQAQLRAREIWVDDEDFNKLIREDEDISDGDESLDTV